MKKTIKTIIVDDNSELVNELTKQFEVSDCIEVLKTFSNGEEALGYIINNEGYIDLIIMDLLIPKLDGLSLLEELKKHNINIRSIVLSSFKDENTIKLCTSLNVSYYLIKPISVSALVRRINETFSVNTNSKSVSESLDLEISQILHNLGIPSHIRGYKYIKDGILIMYNNEDSVSYITKEIYPQIAIKYETTSTRVERAIRHAIEVSWLRGDLALMEDLFGFSVNCDKAKPTNSEFLSTVTERLKYNNSLK